MNQTKTISNICAIPGCEKECRRNSQFCSNECRFWSKFDRSAGPEGCWLWTGSVNPETGYGDVPDHIGGGKRTSAHRRAYTLAHGSPGKLSVLHRCDVKLCGNPAHLFPGTHLDNWLDSVAKGRQTIVQPGEANASAKLSASKVIAIRRPTSRISVMVRKFGVNDSTIRRVLRRETWAHIPEIRKNGDHPEWVFLTGVMDRPTPPSIP